jgi:hypothetical protein
VIGGVAIPSRTRFDRRLATPYSRRVDDQPSILRLREQLAAALRDTAPDRFLALCHDEIEVQTFGLGDRVLRGKREIAMWWAEMRGALVYSFSVNRITNFGDRVALVEGRIRFSRDGWLTDHEAAWVMIGKDGLAWRYRPAEGRGDALAYARSLGVLDVASTVQSDD